MYSFNFFIFFLFVKMRLSNSQIETFTSCKRWWYLQRVRKIKIDSDMKYANRGSVVHEVAEYITNNPDKNIEDVKLYFKKLWLDKKLDVSFNIAENETWLMCVNIFNEKIKLTDTEMEIYSNDPNFVCYIDGVNADDNYIIDYKTSTWVDEEAYKMQMGFYCLFYKKKFGIIPEYADVIYVKYYPFKHKKYSFTLQELDAYEKIIIDANNFIETNKHDINKFTKCVDEGKECGFFCPYKNYCFDDDKKIKFILKIQNNMIFVNGVIPPILSQQLNKKFSYELKNSFWIKKNNPYINTVVKFWNEKYRCLPIGFLDGLKKTLNDYIEFKNIDGEVITEDARNYDETKVCMPDKFLNDKVLRNYQKQAVDIILNKKMGIIESGTGSGKTEIAIECIRLLRMKTLFIVDKVELLNQTVSRIKDSLGVKVGIIGNSKLEIEDVNVATIQTLIKKKNKLAKYLSEIRFVIFDECHKTASMSYLKISKYLTNTEYRIGFSATNFRDDGNDMAITAVTGYKIFELSSNELIKQGFLVKPKIIFLKDYMTENEDNDCHNECKTGLINETEKYSDHYNSYIVHNNKRNMLIKKIVDDNPNKKILIIVKLVEHGMILSNLLNCDYLHGGVRKDKRKKMMNEFKTDHDLLIGTISIFSEGIDIPNLDIIINASANKGDVRTIQSLGRVLRKINGKKDAIYYDFIDYGIFFKYASFRRKKILINQGHDIEIIKS
jgi:superfamily II DNA or RNA helicase